METIKVLFLSFLPLIRYTSGHFYTPAETKVSDKDSSINEQCPCFNITGDTLPRNLYSFSAVPQSIERLVIYIYKDPSSDTTFNIYIPRKQTQILFPDLPLAAGDEFKAIKKESIHKLFKKSHNRVVINIFKPKFAHSHPEHNYEDENITVPIDPDIDNNSGYNVPDRNDSFASSEPLIKPDAYSNDPSFNNEQAMPELFNEHENQPTTELPFNKYMPIVSNVDPQSHQTSNDIAEPIFQEKDFSTVYSSNKEALNKLFDNITDESDISHTPSPETEYYDIPDIVDDSIQTGQSILDDIGTSTEISAPELTAFHPPSRYITFDKWFDEQMHRINKTGTRRRKNIPQNVLKLLVEKTLYDNDMYITNDGLLIDTDGKTLNIANLKLRPILIGNSLHYNTLLKRKDKVDITPYIMHLEGLLLTLEYPPKVLGAIPLNFGNTYLSMSSHRSGFNNWPPKSSLKLSGIAPETISSLLHSSHTHHRHKRPRSYPHTRPVRSDYSKYLYPNIFGGLYKTWSQKRPVTRDNQSKRNQKKQDLIDVLKSIINLDNEEKEIESINKAVIKNVLGIRDFADTNVESWDWGLPDFRIIGGSPATGSGTPVNNKGRTNDGSDS